MRRRAPYGKAADTVANARRCCERTAARLDYVLAGGHIDAEVSALDEAFYLAHQLVADLAVLRCQWDRRRRSRKGVRSEQNSSAA